MKYTKQALSFTDQVDKLEARGLIINNRDSAINTLSGVSYYRLRAYTYPFQDNEDPDHSFSQEIDFNSIISLYRFDQKLRMLVFDAIEKIEVALRTQIIYQFAMSYGSHWQIDRDLYKPPFKNKEDEEIDFFVIHMKTLDYEIERTNETFIEHYFDKYNDPETPPSWMSLEVASMGTLSKIYKSLNTCNAKKKVAKNFGLPNPYILENWILSFTHLRNTCAHHSRLWNRRLTTNIEFPRNTKNMFYKQPEISQLLPYKLFASLLAINYILKSIDSNSNFHTKLKELMQECPLNQETAMGFPNDWDSHPFWN